MRRIVVDASLPEKILQLTEPAELCDANGNVIGRYFPDLTSFDRIEPPISNAELRRRSEQEPGGRPLADILADLERRG